MLNPTPADRLCDAQGRPYFVWDVDLTLDQLREKLGDPAEGDYWLATVLRQAKPDDAIVLVGLPVIAAAWERVAAGVGNSRAFWEWRVRRWREHGE